MIANFFDDYFYKNPFFSRYFINNTKNNEIIYTIGSTVLKELFNPYVDLEANRILDNMARFKIFEHYQLNKESIDKELKKTMYYNRYDDNYFDNEEMVKRIEREAEIFSNDKNVVIILADKNEHIHNIDMYSYENEYVIKSNFIFRDSKFHLFGNLKFYYKILTNY